MDAEVSLERLTDWFRAKGGGGAVVAFSGGVDSTVVAAAAQRALNDSAVAITVKTDFMTRGDVEEAKSVARGVGIRHRVLRLRLPKELLSNPPDRCYRCKKLIMGKLRAYAAENGRLAVVDGTNADDLGTQRPGLRALREEGVLSPLAELGIGKAEVRAIAKNMGLDYAKPSSPCLATRFPFGHLINGRELDVVAGAEKFIKGLGFSQVRVRVRGKLAKVEVGKDELPRMMEGGRYKVVASRLKRLGFHEVCMDLEGYVPETDKAARPKKREGR